MDLSVLLPAYNEERAVGSVIREIRESLQDWPGTWEIVLVDDASTDGTVAQAEALGVRVIRRVENGGFGGACLTGLRHVRGTIVAIMDVDGTYPAAELPRLLSFFPDYDQVNGVRTSEQGTCWMLRMPAKWIIRKLAEWVSGRRIPDLNTGMKLFKRQTMLRYLWALPPGFSCVSSMTLSFLCNGHPVKFTPIPYRKRIGQSKFRPIRDTWAYLGTVFRIVMYFRPIRIFFPLSLAVGLAGLLSGICNVLYSPAGLHDLDVVLVLTALLVLGLGMLAELIVAQHRGQQFL